MKTCYLVRHAQYENSRRILVGRLPVPLSEVGKEESQKLSAFFVNKHIDVIYTSPVVRCKQTSEIIANNKIPVEMDIRLAETLSPYQGYWELEWSHFYGHHLELGGELPEEIVARMKDFWDAIVQKNHKHVIVCSHGDPLYLLYVKLMKKPIPDLQEIYQIPDDEYQPKASIRRITFEKEKVKIDPILTIDQV